MNSTGPFNNLDNLLENFMFSIDQTFAQNPYNILNIPLNRTNIIDRIFLNSNTLSSIFTPYDHSNDLDNVVSIISNIVQHSPINLINRERRDPHWNYALNEYLMAQEHFFKLCNQNETHEQSQNEQREEHQEEHQEEQEELDELDEYEELNHREERREMTQNSVVVNTLLLNKILDYYFSNLGLYPTRNQLIDQVLQEPCRCRFTYSQTQLRELLNFYMFEQKIIPTCEQVVFIMQFKTLEGNYPTMNELHEYLVRMYEFDHDSVEFYKKDRVHVPVLNQDKLPIETCSQKELCLICQEDINIGQKIVKLLPCKHYFHAEPSDCLEGNSIFSWMKEHNHCPLCKQKVSVDYS